MLKHVPFQYYEILSSSLYYDLFFKPKTFHHVSNSLKYLLAGKKIHPHDVTHKISEVMHNKLMERGEGKMDSTGKREMCGKFYSYEWK